ncbi:MAG TPA: cyclic nucleotide-binding domain-containing protein [Fimbriimonadaceae bacterium]|nr:cyclic nucleotide-binding domain-containing protein [Fimbriimonadaceae bacterium]
MTAIKDAIKRTYLLQGLSDEQVEKVAEVCHIKEFDGGEPIVRQYAKDNDLMIVLEGNVRINSFSGEKLAECGPGGVIGEMSLLDDKPRSATVVGLGRCRVALLESESLWGVMNEDCELAKTILLNISRVLCMKLRAANIQLDLTTSRPLVM